ncbi:MAG TPA: hypothetical protein VJZ25_09140, partial [Gemmatimonadaceae bacterium]|nr:hypothetical protein [Gemmatimonadaceae bacterium]
MRPWFALALLEQIEDVPLRNIIIAQSPGTEDRSADKGTEAGPHARRLRLEPLPEPYGEASLKPIDLTVQFLQHVPVCPGCLHLSNVILHGGPGPDSRIRSSPAASIAHADAEATAAADARSGELSTPRWQRDAKFASHSFGSTYVRQVIRPTNEERTMGMDTLFASLPIHAGVSPDWNALDQALDAMSADALTAFEPDLYSIDPKEVDPEQMRARLRKVATAVRSAIEGGS